MQKSQITIKDIRRKKGKEKISMLTCYDYSFAQILDQAGTEMILVGDSLANVVLGLKETRKVSLDEMLNHTAAVARGVKQALVIADMPYLSYQKNPKTCLSAARKFITAGADAVKVEWFSAKGEISPQSGGKDCPYVVNKLVKNKIPVIGHIGLTPQTAHLLGGYKVQGRDKDTATKLIEQAQVLEKLGVFALVLECIPDKVARVITDKLKILTIGIGAGKYCDGQVLVLYDLFGLCGSFRPKFVKVYKDLGRELREATSRFIHDIKKGKFPTKKHSFGIKEKEWRRLKKELI